MARTGENIYKRKDGRWEARYISSYDEYGKAKYKYLYSRTYKEAKEKLINAQNRTAVYIHQGKGTGKYDYWLGEWLQTKKISVKDSSYIRYRNLIVNHISPHLGNYPISKISTELMTKYAHNQLHGGRLDGKGGLSPKTMTDMFVIIKESFKYAQSQGAFVQCSFEHITFKKNKQEIDKIMQEGNASAVIEYADKANERLRRKYYRLTLKNRKKANVAKTAVARELACFIWGMMTENYAMPFGNFLQYDPVTGNLPLDKGHFISGKL